MTETSPPMVTYVNLDDGPDRWSEEFNGESIIKLDWTAIAGGSVPTGDVAGAVADYLLNTSILGKSWLDTDLHLIGHSRGASLLGELARQLGEAGVWVDQVTTLDPHPVDGIRDPFGLDFDDAPMNAWENVVFWDNYWRTDGDTSLDYTGEPIAGAWDDGGRKLDEDVLGVQPNGTDPGYLSEHKDTRLWYHGTIDTIGPIDDGEESVPADAGWYDGNQGPRENIGYFFSRVVGGLRPNNGLSETFGGTGARVPIDDLSNAVWPNIGYLGRDMPESKSRGGTFSID